MTEWGYAIVDSGREWIVPECLARGELLYRDIVYWFGPLTPYLHALLFRLFGASFQTLVLAGVLASIAVLAALFVALRRVTCRAEAVLGTVLAIPALIFMPRAGGAILGMGYRIWHAAAFTLLAVSIAVRPFRWTRAAGAGCLCALAFLCRTEWGLTAMGGVAVAAAARDRFRLSFLRDVLVAGFAFLLVGGGTLAAFVGFAGAGAVLRDGHLLLTDLPPETRRFLLNLSGFRDPFGGFLRLLFSAAAWAFVFLLIDVGATWKEDRGRLRRRLPWIAGIAVTLIAYHHYAGSNHMVFMSGSPMVGLAAVFLGVRRRGGQHSAALCAFGHKLYIPGYLTSGNEAEILAELRSAKPATVVIVNRITPEYGRRPFGVTTQRMSLPGSRRTTPCFRSIQEENLFPPSPAPSYFFGSDKMTQRRSWTTSSER